MSSVKYTYVDPFTETIVRQIVGCDVSSFDDGPDRGFVLFGETF